MFFNNFNLIYSTIYSSLQIRMKTAKLKLYEEEQEKEKLMVERLRTMGIQNGRATSVPLAYNVSRIYF